MSFSLKKFKVKGLGDCMAEKTDLIQKPCKKKATYWLGVYKGQTFITLRRLCDEHIKVIEAM